MLPSSLFSSYLEYKKDTDSIAAWLASTAKHLGYKDEQAEEVGQTAKPAGSKRLKGKARKQAKAAAAAAAAATRGDGGKSETPATARPTHLIRIKDFVTLAQHIAGQVKGCDSEVPRVFDETIGRVIRLRSEFGSKLREHGQKVSKTADGKHSYFVDVLVQVRQILVPFLEDNGPARTKPASATDPTEATADGEGASSLANRFSALDVEEPSLAFLAAPDVRRPEPAANDTALYAAEQPVDFPDLFAAYTMLLNDLGQLQSRIGWIWSNQADGVFDAAAAAVATDTAIGLARSLTQELEPLLQTHEGGAFDLATQFFFYHAIEAGCMDTSRASADGIDLDEQLCDCYDMADRTYMTAFHFLVAFAQVLQPNELPIIKEGIFGRYDAASDRSKKSGHEKHAEDKVLLLEFFTEPVVINRLIPGYPVEDEFTRGMKELDQTGRVPLYLVFAAQIFLDIHHIQRARASSAFEQFEREASFMHAELEQQLEFHKEFKVANWPVANNNRLAQLMRTIRMMLADPVYEAKVKHWRQMMGSAPERHRVLKFSPVMAGLLLYRFRHEMQAAGLALANATGSISYTAHLYNALLHEGLCPSWKDMEICEALLGGSGAFFVGGEAPRDPAGYLSKFCLLMGVSASVLGASRNQRRQRRDLASRAGPRSIPQDATAAVYALFANRYIHNDTSSEWTPAMIDKIIDRSAYDFTEGKGGENSVRLERLDRGEVKEKQKQTRKEKQKQRRRASDGGRLSPEDLIRRLLFALDAETMEAAFPFLAFHRHCWRVLCAAHKSANDALCRLYTPDYVEDESQMPWVVGYILLALSGASGQPVNRQPLEEASEAFQVLFPTGMDKIMTRLVQISIGRDIQTVDEADLD